jgi:hypothetical protein
MLFDSKGQKDIDISGSNSKVIAGDDNSISEHHHHTYFRQTKLSKLFDRLSIEFSNNTTVSKIHDDLKRYQTQRDTIGLKQKLIDGKVQFLYDDAVWLKQEYAKKLTKFALYGPAQEIHAFLLSIVIEKFRNNVYPMILDGATNTEIMKYISENIVNQVLAIISEEGCNDIMGLCSADIEGMVYYLTGVCHIKWKL